MAAASSQKGASDSGDDFAVHRYYQRELDSYDLTPRERNVVLMTLEGYDIGENRRMRAHREKRLQIRVRQARRRKSQGAHGPVRASMSAPRTTGRRERCHRRHRRCSIRAIRSV